MSADPVNPEGKRHNPPGGGMCAQRFYIDGIPVCCEIFGPHDRHEGVLARPWREEDPHD